MMAMGAVGVTAWNFPYPINHDSRMKIEYGEDNDKMSKESLIIQAEE